MELPQDESKRDDHSGRSAEPARRSSFQENPWSSWRNDYYRHREQEPEVFDDHGRLPEDENELEDGRASTISRQVVGRIGIGIAMAGEIGTKVTLGEVKNINLRWLGRLMFPTFSRTTSRFPLAEPEWFGCS